MTEVFDYDKDKVYLVAVSGGPDSMALLDMLYKQKYKIMVAHVNYKKRVESDEEQQMVQHYCETKKIPFYSTDFDSKKVDLKQSFQVQAREFRYHFFSEIYQEKQCDGLFVAHQKDDLIETYLLKKQRNVINESYLILNETIIKKMKVYRPLLNDYKNENEYFISTIKYDPKSQQNTNDSIRQYYSNLGGLSYPSLERTTEKYQKNIKDRIAKIIETSKHNGILLTDDVLKLK